MTKKHKILEVGLKKKKDNNDEKDEWRMVVIRLNESASK